jgi:hypothetical protein
VEVVFIIIIFLFLVLLILAICYESGELLVLEAHPEARGEGRRDMKVGNFWCWKQHPEARGEGRGGKERLYMAK